MDENEKINIHPQTWIKVNVPVDEGIAAIVVLLNTIPGLVTLDSCQGDPGEKDAHVYFCYGGWRQMSQFIFEKIGPALKEELYGDVRLSIEPTAHLDPMAELSFRPEFSDRVLAVLKKVLGADLP